MLEESAVGDITAGERLSYRRCHNDRAELDPDFLVTVRSNVDVKQEYNTGTFHTYPSMAVETRLPHSSNLSPETKHCP
ncbi:hypothetical protein RRG08_041933 [Elysia crispata]|uniref:Uncharacterized protein n=1 Tax=Elysia crispata TaxID=231223 RepID=A0AAE0XWW7_9GAST|nr:hypothetical protein RRG08_041933 [Elysia crispata]